MGRQAGGGGSGLPQGDVFYYRHGLELLTLAVNQDRAMFSSVFLFFNTLYIVLFPSAPQMGHWYCSIPLFCPWEEAAETEQCKDSEPYN